MRTICLHYEFFRFYLIPGIFPVIPGKCAWLEREWEAVDSNLADFSGELQCTQCEAELLVSSNSLRRLRCT